MLDQETIRTFILDLLFTNVCHGRIWIGEMSQLSEFFLSQVTRAEIRRFCNGLP